MDIDNYYWVFSAAAQSISALITLLLAGIALAFPMMDKVTEQDPTLYDVVEALKSSSYGKMAWLAVIAGLAIISSLLATFMNPYPGLTRSFTMSVALITNISAIAGAIYFVTRIVHPQRYLKIARQTYKSVTKEIKSSGQGLSTSTFFNEFIELEKDVRNQLRIWNLYLPSIGEPQMSFSFRQMVSALYQNEKISKELRDKFLEINKYRNLLFHGHIDQIQENIIDKLRDIKQKWETERKRETEKKYAFTTRCARCGENTAVDSICTKCGHVNCD